MQDAVAALGPEESAIVRGGPCRSTDPTSLSKRRPRRSVGGTVEVAQHTAYSRVVVDAAHERGACRQGTIVRLPEPSGNSAAEAAIGQLAARKSRSEKGEASVHPVNAMTCMGALQCGARTELASQSGCPGWMG